MRTNMRKLDIDPTPCRSPRHTEGRAAIFSVAGIDALPRSGRTVPARRS